MRPIHCWRVVLPSSLFPHDTLLLQMDLACCRESIKRNADEREVSGFGSHWVAQGSWKILQSLNVGVHHAPHTIGDFFLIKKLLGIVVCCIIHV